MHSIKDRMTNCENCEFEGTLLRVPSHFISSQNFEKKSNVGDLVKEKIEEFKEELNKEKERLSTEEYKV